MTKRHQINVRSNPYIESLIESAISKSNLKKTDFIHEAIEKFAFEIIGPEEIMNLRLIHLFNNK